MVGLPLSCSWFPDKISWPDFASIRIRVTFTILPLHPCVLFRCCITSRYVPPGCACQVMTTLLLFFSGLITVDAISVLFHLLFQDSVLLTPKKWGKCLKWTCKTYNRYQTAAAATADVAKGTKGVGRRGWFLDTYQWSCEGWPQIFITVVVYFIDHL